MICYKCGTEMEFVCKLEKGLRERKLFECKECGARRIKRGPKKTVRYSR